MASTCLAVCREDRLSDLSRLQDHLKPFALNVVRGLVRRHSWHPIEVVERLTCSWPRGHDAFDLFVFFTLVAGLEFIQFGGRLDLLRFSNGKIILNCLRPMELTRVCYMVLHTVMVRNRPIHYSLGSCCDTFLALEPFASWLVGPVGAECFRSRESYIHTRMHAYVHAYMHTSIHRCIRA